MNILQCSLMNNLRSLNQNTQVYELIGFKQRIDLAFFHIIILILLKYKHYHEIFARFSGPRGPSMTHFCTNLLMNLLTNLQVAYEKVILHLSFFNKKCPKLYKSMFHFFYFTDQFKLAIVLSQLGFVVLRMKVRGVAKMS